MYPVTVSMSSDLLWKTPCLDLAGMIDILWAHAVPADGLEHIGPRIDCETVDLVFFMRSTAQENACQAALAICRRMLSASPALAGWKLVARNVKDVLISITVID